MPQTSAKHYKTLPARLTRWVVAGLLCVCTAARADLYTYTDDAGVLHITDSPTDTRYALTLTEPKPAPATVTAATNANRVTAAYAPPVATASSAAQAAAWQPLIESAAARHNISAALVRAVIHTESSFNPRALSPAGARGLMQLMPATAQRYGVTNAFDPEQNVYAGVRYLAELMAMFKNDLTLALAAYNAGENAVVQHGNKVPPYRETQRETQAYVPKVLAFYRQYQARQVRI